MASFIQQILAPGGGIALIPFTRVVICCLFLTTSTVFVIGVARIHMFILSFLSAGMYFSLGFYQKEYSKFMMQSSAKNVPEKRVPSKMPKTVSKAKRED